MKQEEINPILKLAEMETFLTELGCTYTIHQDSTEKDYTYLRPGDICITIKNPTWEYPMYIDLEKEGEFSLSYYKWHNHYYPEEWDFQRMQKDLQDLLQNKRCEIILNSTKRWLYSGLSEEKLDDTCEAQKEIKLLPREFQAELEQEEGNLELIYWDSKGNITKDIPKKTQE